MSVIFDWLVISSLSFQFMAEAELLDEVENVYTNKIETY